MSEIVIGLFVIWWVALIVRLVGKLFIDRGIVDGYFELVMYALLALCVIAITLIIAWLVGSAIMSIPGIKG